MEANTTDRFIRYIKDHHLCNKGERILLAVSGGSDSMMLTDLFLRTGFEVAVAHCNFKLRAADSDADEAFVKAFCETKGVPFYVTRFETGIVAAEEKISIEEAARKLRYAWFEDIRQGNGYTFIATAHHLNDNVETLLFNFFRGTGIHGLHAIAPKQGKIIRPMLFLTKKEVLAYVADRNIDFVEDASNRSVEFTRNYLRHRVIPLLESAFPGLDKRLSQNIIRFSEAEKLYEQSIEFHRRKLVETRGTEAFVSILKLKKSQPLLSITYEIFKDWNFSFEQSRQIIGILDSEPGKRIVSETHRLIRDRKWLIISPLAAEEVSHLLIEQDQSQVETAGMHLSLKIVPGRGYKISGDAHTASLDTARITYPLVLRRWRQGDYFYPLGLKKKKKLSRFFIDRKLSLNDKEKVWVLESGGRIIWVVGMRVDDRFKIRPSTREVLRIRMW